MSDLQILNKIIKLQEVVQNVIRSNQLYKTLGFLEGNDLNTCITYAESIYSKLKKTRIEVETTPDATDAHINTLQDIIREISTLISLYGCDTLENLISIIESLFCLLVLKLFEKFNSNLLDILY